MRNLAYRLVPSRRNGNMNKLVRPKCRLYPGAVVLAVAVCSLSLAAGADDGNLAQQVRIEQHRSNFQLMLEQVQESARRRAAAARERGEIPRDGRATATDLGDSAQSLRLDPVGVTAPALGELEPESARRLRADQAYERDQRRILDERQRRSALIAGSRNAGPAGSRSFSVKRREVVRFDSQNQRQSLQRKLRR